MASALDQLPRTEEWLEGQSEHWASSGVQIYLQQGDTIVLDEGFGWASVNVPMTRETINLWMSSGKPITAVAVLQLIEQGLFELSTLVADIIPEFTVHGKDNISILHLLTHTAGFRAADMNWRPVAWDQAIAQVCAVRPEPRWIPGEKAGYQSDGSWYMLGEIVARVTGDSLPAYLKRKILAPLGMNHSWMGIPESAMVSYGDGIAEVLNLTSDPPVLMDGVNGVDGLSVIRPGGNMRGPVSDLGKFYRALLQGGGAVLRAETVDLMTRRHREGMYDHSFRHVVDCGLGVIINSNRYGAETVPYGYGLMASDATYGHSGRESSVGFADPEHDLVVGVVFNSMPGEVMHQMRMRALLQCIYEDLSLGSR